MRILVTGGSGMLGKSVVNALTESARSDMLFVPPHAELNLLEYTNVCSFLRENKIDSVIHCAALVGGIQANIAKPFDYLNTNVRIDSNLINAAMKEQVTNFLYMASSCMYPAITQQPMKETQILTGALEVTNEGYALAKILGTKTVEAIGKKLNWRTLILSNMYGPGDKYDDYNSHLVAAIIKKVLDAKATTAKQIKMWGTGNVRREFTFVNDVAEYISTIIFKLDKIPQVMNLGSGVDYSVKEYYDFVCELALYEGEIISDPSQPEGMLAKLMDSSIANENGWRPSTNIKDGIKLTIDDFMLIHQGMR
jgi:nucleoside-diphosphate-sugar epimerase